MPDKPNNREGPEAREPSKCLNRQSYGERLAKEDFWSPAIRGLKKDSDRAITTVCVPAHLAPPGSPQAKQLCHLHSQFSVGQSCQRQKKSHVYARRVASVVSNSLWPCRLWPAGLLCQGRASPSKNTGVHWPVLVAIPLYSTTFPAALAANSPEYLALTEPLRPKKLYYLHTWPSQGQTQILQGSPRSKPQWLTHMQRWK